ncbi:hypothetical protein M8J77_017156 [Diaphorina citri]|nr:hypothetical protein M8J77_017156 [Diaphorina citri]
MSWFDFQRNAKLVQVPIILFPGLDTHVDKNYGLLRTRRWMSTCTSADLYVLTALTTIPPRSDPLKLVTPSNQEPRVNHMQDGLFETNIMTNGGTPQKIMNYSPMILV